MQKATQIEPVVKIETGLDGGRSRRGVAGGLGVNTLAAIELGFERADRWILRDICLELQPRKVTALVGPNGSGKSTLLRCMAGLWRPSIGQVTLGGRDINQLRRPEIARQVTYVPQETKLEFEFTVREIVLMGRYAHRGRFDRETAEDRDAAEQALRRADITHIADRSVTQLSGGERQRVLIARSLATRAHTLLLDEPTANLDVDHGLDVLDLCRSLADDGHAVAIATHDLNAVCRFVDQVGLIDSGRLIAVGTPLDVLTPDNLARAFRVRSETVIGSDGTPQLLFHRMAAASSAAASSRTSK
jgi:iron complex transport system ATP-binding protein